MCKNAQDNAKDITTLLYYSIKKNINHKASLPTIPSVSAGFLNEYSDMEYREEKK